jgi:PAS domain-containing protein
MSPKLQASERFREVADFLREVLLLSNLDFSKILFVNRAYEAIWGRTVESLYENPRSWLEGIHPDERKHVQEAVQRLVDGESLQNLECRVVRRMARSRGLGCVPNPFVTPVAIPVALSAVFMSSRSASWRRNRSNRLKNNSALSWTRLPC